MSIQNISNIIYDIREKLTDYEFKMIMDNLMSINKQIPEENTEQSFINAFYRQFFHHSHQNNKYFKYQYINQDNSIILFYEHLTKRLCIGDTFIYEKIFDDNVVENIEAIIVKISPRYTIIKVNNYNKKISNITLCKVYNYPYIIIL